MAFELTGKLVDIQPVQKISDSFQKRDFAIETTSQGNNGMTYTNYAAFQLTNNACAMIENFQIGQDIKVTFDIRGNKWEKDGQTKYFSNLSAWRIEPAGMQQQMPPQGSYAPNPSYGQAAPQQSSAPSFDAGNSGADDLPF